MMQAVTADRRMKYNDPGKVFSSGFGLAIIVITSGFLLMLAGIILSAISFVSHGKFHGWDVITLVASFVFLAFGAHFLDQADATAKAARLEKAEFKWIKNEDGDATSDKDKRTY